MQKPGGQPGISVGNPSDKTLAKQKRFLLAFEAVGVIDKAAKMAGTSREMIYKWMKSDLIFREEVEDARKVHTDKLEGILFDLIQEMHNKLDYKANPTLLVFALNGAMPEKYKGTVQPNSDARDVISEFRKAMRQENNIPEQTPEKRPERMPSIEEQAQDIIQSKRGSLNDSSNDK